MMIMAICATALHARADAKPSDWTKLQTNKCQAASLTKYPGSWPAAWQPFLQHAKACPLQAKPGQAAEVWLLSIWAEDYLAAHPEIKDWPAFPHPLLVDRRGHCLGALPELYPFDEPRSLTLSYERSSGYPGQISVSVDNPAMGGRYMLAPMKWDGQQARYITLRHTKEHKIEESSCPN